MEPGSPGLARQPVYQRLWTAAAIGIGLLAAAILLAGMLDLPRRQREASRQVAHTLEVQDAAATVQAHFEEFLSEGRGYLNSRFADTKAHAEAAAARTRDDMAVLRALTADNPAQQRTLDEVGRLIDQRVALLRSIWHLAETESPEALRQRLQTRTGHPLTDAILDGLNRVKTGATQQLVLRRTDADRATRQTVAALVICGIVAAACGLLLLMLLVGRRRERRHLAELRANDALLRTIMQTVPGLIYAKDLQGRMIVANPAVLDLVGKPWSAIEGRTDVEFLDDPADGEAVMANDRQVIAEGRTHVVEERVGTGSETPRVWLSTKTPMRDADGAIVGMVGLSVDITERKQAEERLRAFNAELEARVAARTRELAASEARQRGYFRHSPIGMVVMRVRDDGQFVLEDLNPAARTAFGFGPDRAPGLTQAELWPELVARDKQQKMQACASRREVIDYAVEREIGGEKRLLHIVLAPLLDETASARFVLICVHDVTRQRALERQIVEQAERQAEAAEREMALFNNSPDELFVVRVDESPGGPVFVYEAFSPALELVTGLNSLDLIGRRPEECLPAAMAQTILAHYRRCLAQQATVKFAETRTMPVGQRDVEGYVSPVRHPGTGRIVRLVGSVRDVTERNRMEAALRHGHKMEAIGRLAAGVAHDFNNILQAVIGALDMVIDEVAADTQAQEFARVALGSAMRGSHLTHHLLAYARKQMLWPQPIDLATFLPEIETVLSRTLGPHIAIGLDVRQTPRAMADPGELQTALLNLAINASQAMPKVGTLRIDALTEEADGRDWARITVTDTGIGMDAATLAQAGEPFFTTKGLGGTGLGLSMVQGFAEQSGGTLRIASTPGRGTAVELRLPAGPPAERRPAPETTATTRASGRVLLVDDSTDVLVTVGAFLGRAGFEVTRAESGASALALLTADRGFDALVTDYAMPGLNGSDLIARARLLKTGLPALVITGYASIDEADVALDGVLILRKPFHSRELIQALVGMIGRAAPGAEAARHVAA